MALPVDRRYLENNQKLYYERKAIMKSPALMINRSKTNLAKTDFDALPNHLLKRRVFSCLVNEEIFFCEFSDAAKGKFVVSFTIEMKKISKQPYLDNEEKLVLLDFFHDFNNVPKLLWPLVIAEGITRIAGLKGKVLKKIAREMHHTIPKGYPFKDIVKPREFSVIKTSDDFTLIPL
jgi:hypothetical protein